MIRKVKWTLDACIYAASKFESRNEWCLLDNKSYQAAVRNKWISECCSHMKAHQDSYTLEDCKREAAKHFTRLGWQKSSKSTYHKALSENWLDECCKHMQNPKKGSKPNEKKQSWSVSTLKEDARKYANRTEWRKNSGKAYNAAYRKGVLDECCTHMPKPKKWTVELLVDDAKRFESRSEWKRESQAAYMAAYRSGLLDLCCNHMD